MEAVEAARAPQGVVLDVGINVAFNYATTGELNVGGALKESALGLFNPATTLAKAGKLAAFIVKSSQTQAGRYKAKVIEEVDADPGARQRIPEWEERTAERLRGAGHLNDPSRHVKP